MQAWILSLVLCAAAPTADGSYCSAMPLAFGLSREMCHMQRIQWSQHASRPRLECFFDPELTARLSEEEGDGEDELEDDVSELTRRQSF